VRERAVERGRERGREREREREIEGEREVERARERETRGPRGVPAINGRSCVHKESSGVRLSWLEFNRKN